MELNDGAGDDILVETVEADALESNDECKLDNGDDTRDDGRLTSSSACLAREEAALRWSYACLRRLVRDGEEWWIARACISSAVAA